MEAIKPLEKEISHYLSRLNTHEQEVVLSVIKSIAGEEYEWWNDKEYMSEIERRTDELEKGIVKGVSLKELELNAKEAYRIKKQKES